MQSGSCVYRRDLLRLYALVGVGKCSIILPWYIHLKKFTVHASALHGEYVYKGAVDIELFTCRYLWLPSIARVTHLRARFAPQPPTRKGNCNASAAACKKNTTITPGPSPHLLRCSTFALPVPLLAAAVAARRPQAERLRPRHEQSKHHAEQVQVDVSGGTDAGELVEGLRFCRAKSFLLCLASSAAVHLSSNGGKTVTPPLNCIASRDESKRRIKARYFPHR